MSLISISHFSENNHANHPFKINDTQNTLPTPYAVKLLEFNRSVQQIIADYYRNRTPDLLLSSRFFEDYAIAPTHVTVNSSHKKLPAKHAEIIRAIDRLYHYFIACQKMEESRPSPLCSTKQQTILTHSLIPLVNSNSQSEELDSPSATIPFKLLPREIVDKIFSFAFANWQDVGRASLACKAFYEVASHPTFLKLFFQNHPEILATISSPELHRHFLALANFHPSHLNHLQVALKDEDLKMLADQGSRLENLRLQGGQFTPEGLAHLLKKCPHLRSLEFHRNPFGNFDDYIAIVALYAPQIEQLRVIDCSMTDQSLFALAASRHNLRSFEYWNSLSQGALTDYGLISFFANTSYLETLKLTGCPQVTENTLITLIENNIPTNTSLKGSKLKSLQFSYCGLVGEDLYASLAHSCPNLEALELGMSPAHCLKNPSIKSSHLLALFQACTHLSSAKFSDCTYLTADLLDRLIAARPNLEELELYRCHSLMPSLTKSFLSLSNLKSLKFEPNRGGAMPVQNFFLPQSNLETLNLVNCAVTEEELIAYLKGKGESLRNLQLTNCGAYGAELLKTLARHCPNLETLEIETAKQAANPYSDEAVHKLVKGCPTLQTLHLKSLSSNSSWELSSRSLGSLAKYCPQLRHLTLSYLNLNGSSFKEHGIVAEERKKHLMHFARRCIKLTHLGLPSSQLKEEEALFLLYSYAPQLSSLDLGKINWLTNNLLSQISKCPKLRNLQLNKTLITPKLISKVILSLPYLNYLNLKECPKFQTTRSESLKKFKDFLSSNHPFLYVKF